MVRARLKRLVPCAAALIAACALSACTSAVDMLPEKIGGLPESAPKRPAETLPYQNVYEVRPTRQVAPLNDDEQKKLEGELSTLRTQQQQLATQPYPPPPPPPPPPAPAAKKAAAKKPADPKKPADDKKQSN
jgi:hypothetical protein